MRILIADTFYDAYLRSVYDNTPGLENQSYESQWRVLMDGCFGTADFYSRNLETLGHEAHEVIVNCRPLQAAWAKERGLETDRMEKRMAKQVFAEQVKDFQPDVLYLQDITHYDATFLDSLRDWTKLIVGQCAYALDWSYNFRVYDLLVTSFIHYVGRFKALGVDSEYLRLAFEPAVRGRIEPMPERDIDVSFVGSLTHSSRSTGFLQQASQLPLRIWGHPADSFPAGSPLAGRYKGEAWGLDMFRLLARSKVVLNRHADTAEDFANNMRLYEATGMEACLLTDSKRNLGELFVLGTEVVAYESSEDLIEKGQYLLQNEKARSEIARAGLTRTLSEHTYAHRMVELSEILERALSGQPRMRPKVEPPRRSLVDIERLRELVRGTPIAPVARLALKTLAAFRPKTAVSAGYQRIDPGDVDDGLIAAWQNPAIPGAQWSLVRDELQRMYSGDVTAVFQVAADALKLTGLDDPLVVEVGCAGGYYSEVLNHLLGPPIRYVGLDYSPPLVHQAAKHYPNWPFVVGDATRVPLREASCDVLFCPAVIMHIPDYSAAITEAFRVSSDWVIFHRTPVTSGPTTFMTKKAYGVPVVELVFSEEELKSLFEQKGEITKELLIDSYDLPGVSTKVHMKTYVCRKN